MTPEIQAQLAQLRDIRLPEQVGWWPIAHGWWLALALICGATLGLFIYDAWRKRTARVLALRELDALSADDPQGFAANLSQLLRRIARRNDEHAAQLSGASWANYLTQHGLAPDLAAHLADATYARPSNTSPAPTKMRDAAAIWIRRQS